ncbi:hypothetical protein [Achromobacter kerstersii]|uniref:Uncharacterized protein n=1 Tax=Achromobacter kerstersii TaxID=1353890 RepID=A0A6S6ZNI9_9BURK|nr:hypothetical protein [Achromobacter kerstersii]CAB3677425.1 hypothetical protein LMG3441_01404 [Achromobacter kerstersii]
MPSNTVKWIVSIVLGLLIGRVSYGVLLPVILALSPREQAATSGDPDTMIVAGLVIWLVVTVIASVLLARIANLRRLIGWGCVALGAAMVLTIPATLLTMDVGAHATSAADTRDANTALFFWALIFGLPYVGGGLVLAILGTVLVRKHPAAKDPVLN